jgi:hypothetical protein
VPVVSEWLKDLPNNTAQWKLPSERRERWELFESWRGDLQTRLRNTKEEVPGVPNGAGVVVQALDLRERTSAAGTVALQWVVKVTNSDRSAGSTLLVDADSGDVRYLIQKPAPEGRDDDLLRRAGTTRWPRPTERALRVFAFDPSAGTQLETAGINQVTLRIPWERDAKGGEALEAGPKGEYLEVIDYDPTSEAWYEPVDLNDKHLVAQAGLPPSEDDPRFHQQMVYAVTMRIIRDFERALGRLVLWAPHRPPVERDPETGTPRYRDEEFVQRLRIHPHALREANAYYSPSKVALLFGYFPAPKTGLNVFTCLSHDIIAHEVTHALLDGIHRRFNEASNPDVHAFHEAFADIVALFEHFSLPEVLHHQIAMTRGDLESQNRLGELAQQFGEATGQRGALRSAIGSYDKKSGEWQRRTPNPDDYAVVMEPHARGAILVAAVFDAFLTLYKDRVADLLRIATDGTGVLPAGQLHPDLVGRLADEAAAAAREVLLMCIRALDYCPPVDLNFGDYLRAIVTADFDNDPIDRRHRRVAFVEAFRSHGIVPDGIRAFSVDGLRWRRPTEYLGEPMFVKKVTEWFREVDSWNLTKNREELFGLMRKLRAELHDDLRPRIEEASETFLGGINPKYKFEVHSVRPSTAVDWSEERRFQWVIELTQRVPKRENGETISDAELAGGEEPGYYFRGGCTLLVDAETGEVRYAITKLLHEKREKAQRSFVLGEDDGSLTATYFGAPARETAEPFAMVHRFA